MGVTTGRRVAANGVVDAYSGPNGTWYLVRPGSRSGAQVLAVSAGARGNWSPADGPGVVLDSVQDQASPDSSRRGRVRTVTAAAALIQRLTCVHGSLTAACHSAACRPPGKNGGTGGSDPGPGGHNRTAFTSEIESMIRADKDLETLSAAWHQNSVNDAIQRKIERKRNDESRGRIDTSTFDERPWQDRPKSGTPEFDRETAVREEVRWLSRKFEHMADPNFIPGGEIERKMFEAVQKHLKRDDIASATRFEHEGVTVQLNGASLRLEIINPGIEVPPGMEQAVNRVGQRINKEITERMKSFDPTPAENEYLMISDGVTKIVREYFPNATHNDWNFTNYGDGTYVQTLGHGSNAEMGRLMFDHPMKQALRAYMEGKSVGNDIDAHIARRRDDHFQRIALEVLSEIRSMNGTFKNTPRKVKPKSGSIRAFSTYDQVTKGATFYPTDWIDRSNGHDRTLQFKQTKSRAHYQHNGKDGFAVVTLDGSLQTTVHEMAHRMERVIPGVLELESQFFDRRTAGETFKHLGKGYGKDEVAKEDQFYNPYVGKNYGNQAYEVLSMGTQQLTSERAWAKVDPDYQAFVLGTLATAYWK